MNHDIIKNNLKNCPTIYYISSEKFKNRHKIIDTTLNFYGLNYKSNIFSEEEDKNTNYCINNFFLNDGDPRPNYVTLSHLKTIKKWLDESNDDIAFFIEDDISFETVEYWNFTIEDFIKIIPQNFDGIQLHIIKENGDDFNFKKPEIRKLNDWSLGAYILKRNYAKKLIEYYINDNFYNLILPHPYSDYQSIPEYIIYLPGLFYSFPLFVENVNVETTFNHLQTNIEIKNNIIQKANHYSSYEKVIKFWKTNSFCCTQP